MPDFSIYFVRRIFKDYESFDKKPEYYISDNGVIVTLYNRNYAKNIDTQKNIENKSKNQNDTQNDTQKNRVKTILELIKENSNITIKEIGLKLKVSRPTVYRDMKYLKENNILEYQGSSKKGKWIIKK
ncbi:helix-turn-helix domain-containing protein [Fusobacterium canifelinum]|uniref:helix-turn-helix domain-containing protein n=1 Tax=Fusobacterium canifelinum TaxID=285729 RepID=UPI001F27EDD4|nr:HTH domain-containing protein [Fusobacterium canifelinum]